MDFTQKENTGQRPVFSFDLLIEDDCAVDDFCESFVLRRNRIFPVRLTSVGIGDFAGSIENGNGFAAQSRMRVPVRPLDGGVVCEGVDGIIEDLVIP